MDTLQTSPDDAPLRHDRPLRNGDSSSHASSSPASGRGPAPGTASRGRKSRALPLDSMSPAAVQGRKRAMDRKSQQAFRDKNKNYIAYLEQTVDACAAGNETNMVGQLLKRNQQLYKANERLRKILNDTLFSLQLELSSLPSNDEATENSFPMEPVSISAPPLDLALMHPTSSVPPLDASIEVANINVTPPPPHTTSHTSLHQFQDPQEWFMDGKASNGAFRSCQREYPGLQFAVAQSSLNPLTSLHCDSFLVNPSQEDFWHWSNSVYARIFVFPPWQARLATDFQDDVIFKAIRNGWDSLNANMQQNPIVQILRDYDDMISITTTKINRAVIAFKNAALIKV